MIHQLLNRLPSEQANHHYGKDNPENEYSMNALPLSTDISEKDLGVTFDTSLNFRQHIGNMIAKANSRVGLIKRAFSKLNPSSFKLLYKQRVLMHGHQGWNVRHSLCHIYMRYVYIYELFIAFVFFVVCSLLWLDGMCGVLSGQVAIKRKYRHVW